MHVLFQKAFDYIVYLWFIVAGKDSEDTLTE